MDKWKVLGIDKSRDKGRIKEAYRKKLTEVNPEDDQEGFMRLREAYEWALKEADEEETKGEAFDDTPMGRWMGKVDECYRHFSKRLQIELWEELLQDDLCIALDTRPEGKERLLRYLMDHFNLPRGVWKLIDETFDVEEGKEELYESYPKDFIDYVIRNAKYEGALNYGLFGDIDDAKDYDGFIERYYQIYQNNHGKQREEVEKGLEEIGTFGIGHPYVELERAKYYLSGEEGDKAREVAERLLRELPEDEAVVHVMAEVEWTAKEYAKALAHYEKVLDIRPQHYYAKTGVADCCVRLGKLGEAREIYMDLLDVNRFDGYVLSGLMTADEEMIAHYRENEGDWKDNFKNRMEYAWCYFQRERYQECLELLNVPEPSGVDALELVYIKGRTRQFTKEYETCRECFRRWLALYHAYEGEENEEFVKNKKRLGIVYSALAEIDAKEESWDQAFEHIRLAIETNDENKAAYYNQKAVLFKKLDKKEEAFQALRQALDHDERHFEAYLLRGEIYQEEGRYQEAVDDYEQALAIYPYYERPHVKELEIFCEMNATERMKETLERAGELQIETGKIRLFQAKLLRREEKYGEAVSLMEDLLKELDEGEEDAHQFYQEIAAAYYDNEQYEQALPHIQKAIRFNPEDAFYHCLCGYILHKLQRYQEAVASFGAAVTHSPDYGDAYYRMSFSYRDMGNHKKAVWALKQTLKLNPLHPNASGALGELYEELRRFGEAKKHYAKQLELNPTDYYYICKGLIHFMEAEFDEALQCYANAKVEGSENPYPYFNEARVYLARRQNEMALESLLKAVEMAGKECPEVFIRYLRRCYTRMEEWEKALESCDLQIARKLRVTDAFIQKSDICRRQGRYQEALACLEEGLRQEKSDQSEFYLEMGRLYDEGLQCHGKAKKCFKRAIRCEPKNGYAYRELAEFYYRRRSYKKALNYYRKAVDFDCDAKAHLYERMAQCCDKIGRDSDMKREYVEQAIKECQSNQFDKTELTYYDCILTRVFLLEGRKEEAKRLCGEVFAPKACLCDFCNEKDCHEAFYLKGLVCEGEGETESALRYYRKALETAPHSWEYVEAVERLSGGRS